MDLCSYGSIMISKRDSQLLGRSSTILVAGFLHSSSTETMASGLLSVSNLNWITTHDHSKVKACTHSIYTTKSLLVPTAGIHCRQSWNSRPTHVSHSPRKIKPLTTFRADLTVGAAEPDPIPTKFSKILDAFWRFLRPHTIRGTVIGSIALVSRALLENSHLINWSLLPKALCGVLALICGNGYIVGINQIYDIGIDKVNKPFLPIAAGDLSVKEAWFLVLLFAAVGITIVIKNFGPFISILYGLGLFLGSIYSVPPFRMKRYPVAAFLIIATVRGFLLNFGVYYSVRAALGLSFQWSPAVAFITTFVTLFALVIAITKDLPDVEGDRKFQISTLATKLGVRNITFLGSGILLVNYVGAIVAAVYMPQVFRRSLMISTHCILAVGLVLQTWILDQSQYTKDAIAKFYRFIWNLFYAEYLLFPFL